MCGISLALAKNGFQTSEIALMNQTIRHRGPDSEGFVLLDKNGVFTPCMGVDTLPAAADAEMVYRPISDISAKQNAESVFAMGHRRLSIIDLSVKGHQPMADTTGQYWIVFNGEVYNYLEIKEELIKSGVEFFSDSDTEVILEAYKKWGAACQEKFNGMWAFAIYNTLANTVFLSRDRFGIKPLYYWVSPAEVLYFGSEIKQFTVLPGWEARLNKARAIDYLLYSLTDHTNETMFEGVSKIAPGHCLVLDLANLDIKAGQTLKQEKWFSFSNDHFNGTFEEAQAIFRAKFKSAVKLHMRSDVPLGTALSGGLDSTAIVTCVKEFLNEDVHAPKQKTFSACGSGGKYDEQRWIDIAIEHTQVEAHFVSPNCEEMFRDTEKIIWHMDEPYQSQSAFMSYHVFRKAREEQVIVLLNGQGADEYLSGYTDFQNLRLRKLIFSGHLKAYFSETASRGFFSSLKSMISLMYSELPHAITSSPLFWTGTKLRMWKLIKGFRVSLFGKHPYRMYKYRKKSVKEISAYQLCVEPLQKYLRWEDRNSMASSVEARVPFLDYRLVEFVRSLPLDFLDAPGEIKRILTSALKGILPEAIRTRKDKIGFITPEEDWFKNTNPKEFISFFERYADASKGMFEKAACIDYLVSMQKGEIPFDYSYWRLILFHVWMRRFDVKP